MVASHLHPPSVLRTSIAHVSRPSDNNMHTQYVVRVSDERCAGLNWTVYRRYSEFRLLRLRLYEAVKRGDMCAHCEIMSKRTAFMQFPHRRLFWNMKDKVLESRRIGLNAFLETVAKHARTCRESTTCKTRELMNDFLDVNELRYTYLDVHMSDSEDEFRTKFFLHSTGSASSTRSSSMFAHTPTNVNRVRASSLNDNNRETNQTQDNATTVPSYAKTSQHRDPLRISTRPGNDNDGERVSDGRVLTAKLSSLPNLLDYGRGSCISSSRNSLYDSDSSRPSSRLSDWENAKYPTASAGRHSDPGVGRNELLNFASCSSSSGRRPEQRSRPRRVHLSSAAKRVKKLEEQEARFATQPPTRRKKMAVLPTIHE